MSDPRPPHLIILGDTPTVNTGFAEVIRNLAERWRPHFPGGIDIWGLNYHGWPHEYPYRIYPAGFAEWNTAPKLQQFLNLIGAKESRYTHLFVLCDCHNISGGRMPEFMMKVCTAKNVRSVFYYPVDAHLEREWLDAVAACDACATYTEYGKRETKAVMPKLNPAVIGHGVDTSVFHPREDINSLRARFPGAPDWIKPDDFVMVNVNRNERRKAPHLSLEILRVLLGMGLKAKLILHMPRLAPHEGTDLELVGKQIGLPHGEHWRHNDQLFAYGNGQLTTEGLNMMYNASDLVLSTSYGEGWGLSITEGAAAGCRVACPDHTSCAEIASKFNELGQANQIFTLPVLSQCNINPMDSSRVRYPVDVSQAAETIAAIAHRMEHEPRRLMLNDAVKSWLDWDRIAGEFLKLFFK